MQAQVLAPREWAAAATRHEHRVAPWVEPHLERAVLGQDHPVFDFLFTYYAHSPGALRRWHPGAGVTLAGDPPHRGWGGYRVVPGGVTADLDKLDGPRGESTRSSLRLLRATAASRPFFGCHGLHEWAMVYRSEPAAVRHASWPLRLAPAELNRVVEAAPLRCTHFDAFRFFTPPARPLNTLTLTRAGMPAVEQGGCLHTNMDLYKHAFRLGPLAPSELVADCFALARDLRELDMRASPYDLSALGYEPVPIETPDGRAQYAADQRDLAARATPLRARLLELMERLVPE